MHSRAGSARPGQKSNRSWMASNPFMAQASSSVPPAAPETPTAPTSSPAARNHDAALEEVWRTSLPGRAVEVIAPGEALPESHPAKGKGQIDGMPTAYVCIGSFCSLPVTGRSALAASLKEIRAMRAAPGAPPIQG